MSTAPSAGRASRGRPDAPFYVGTTQPGAVGWTRIGIAAVVAAASAVAGAMGLVQLPFVLAIVVFCVGFAAIAWMRMSTRFIVDDRGVTVSLGGFWKRPTWPVEDFAGVQLREIPAETLGVTVGGYGMRRGLVLPAERDQVRAIGGRHVRTSTERENYLLLVTRPGTMVEIFGKGMWHYMISPVDAEATAAAIDQAIRARR